MSKLRFLIAAISMASGTTACLAQSPPPVPTPPYLDVVKPSAAWKITVSTTQDGQPLPATPASSLNPPLVETDVTKWADRKVVEDKFGNGKSYQTWFYRGFALMSQRHYMNGSIAVFPDDGRDPAGFDLSDFPDLKWISRDTFLRAESKDGVNCDLFEQLSKDNKTDAWISTETKLPVVVESTQTNKGTQTVQTQTYAFETITTPPERVPENFLKPYHDRLRRMRLPIQPDN